MRLRIMTMADIPAGMRLKEIAGWNQTAADWKRFLEAGPAGCFAAEEDRRVCGTATTISFENRFAWVGMVLVDPEYRSRGIGTRLLERAIEHLDDLKIPAIKLDATPQGKPLYEKLGFVSEYEIERWTLRRSSSGAAKASGSGARDSFSPGLLESICKADQEIFGADRSLLLKSLDEDAPDLATGRLQGDSPGLAHEFLFLDVVGDGHAALLEGGHHLLRFCRHHPDVAHTLCDQDRADHAVDVREERVVCVDLMPRIQKSPKKRTLQVPAVIQLTAAGLLFHTCDREVVI